MTTFRIAGTQEIETLTLIDSKSGCCWLNDAMAGDNNITPFECDDDGPDADVQCSQETYDWWSNFATEYQKANEKWGAILNNTDSDKHERMIEAYANAFDNDLESYPAILNGLCDQFGSLMLIATDSCGGLEGDFESWVNKNHPDIETRVENTLDGGLFNSDGERIEDEKYWDLYCKQ